MHVFTSRYNQIKFGKGILPYLSYERGFFKIACAGSMFSTLQHETNFKHRLLSQLTTYFSRKYIYLLKNNSAVVNLKLENILLHFKLE